MKKKASYLFLSLFTIVTFSSFQTPVRDNSRVSFSAKIESINEEFRHEKNGDSLYTFMKIHASLKNNTDKPLILILWSCNPNICLIDTPIFEDMMLADCYWNGPIQDKLGPHDSKEITGYFGAKNYSIQKLKGLKFSVCYNFVTLDMFPKDSLHFTRRCLLPSAKLLARTKNYICSDTLEIN